LDPSGSGVGVEEIFADIDADKNAAHGEDSDRRIREQRVPLAFLFKLVNGGSDPGDYSNQGTPIPERTQLTPGPMRSLRRTVSLQDGLVIHNPGFHG
jgi:hypothetical protein